MRVALIRALAILAIPALLLACGGGGGGGGGAAATPVVLVSESALGVDGNGDSDQQVMSADGRYVAFRSAATNLLAVADALAFTDVFRKDMMTGDVIRVSRTPLGAEPNGLSRNPAISADGRYIAYVSEATNIIAGSFAGGGRTNVFLFDTVGGGGTTTLMSHSTVNDTTDGTGSSDFPSIGVAAGPVVHVAFESLAQDHIAGLAGYTGANIFRKIDAGAMALVSRDVTTATTTGNGASTRASIATEDRKSVV